MLDMITAVTGLKFEIGDGMPTSICSQCKKIAADAYNFKMKSLEADTTLRDMIKKKCDTAVTSLIGFEDSVKMEDEVDLKYESFYEDSACNDLYNCLSTTEDEFSNLDIIKSEIPNRLNKANPESENSIKVEKDDISYCPVCGLSIDGETGMTNHILKQHAEVTGPKKRGRPKTALAKRSDMLHASKTMFLNEQNYASHVCDENELQDDYVLKMSMDIKDDEKFFNSSLEAVVSGNDVVFRVLQIYFVTEDLILAKSLAYAQYVVKGTALQNHRKAHGHFPTTSLSTQDRVQGLLDKTLHTNIIKTNKRDVNAS
ncbi:hypothetical protein EVAR_68836_1 [Eumeta japonica]|uniref:ZAD domain-containing protein n=1 Tax=Eumeta variegata TaxID=151549 RepID=A0A4C1SI76_EUMVA|nr:hypothetical protein EVAR_68836_1 [Eumeta japonica]